MVDAECDKVLCFRYAFECFRPAKCTQKLLTELENLGALFFQIVPIFLGELFFGEQLDFRYIRIIPIARIITQLPYDCLVRAVCPVLFPVLPQRFQKCRLRVHTDKKFRIFGITVKR